MTDAQTLIRDDISTAIRHYLDALEGKDGATLYDLAKTLDGLVSTYHRVPDVEPDTTEASAAPRSDERPIIDAANAAFPDLDWYALVDPQEGQEQAIGMSIAVGDLARSEEHTSELQSLMRISYAVFCLKKKNQ